MNITILNQKISDIRGHKVLLDADMAQLYGVGVQAVKEAVTQHKRRFPSDFAFELTIEEANSIGAEAGSWAFTEHGVAMLACLINTARAEEMSVAIVRDFVNMRRVAINYTNINSRYAGSRGSDGIADEQLHLVYDTVDKLLDKKIERQKWDERERIGFKKA